jgi:hypothetical protein
MGHKSKFNKNKCKTCKYHSEISLNGSMIICYHVNSGLSSIYREGKGNIDRRGNDFNNCLLYERGKA